MTKSFFFSMFTAILVGGFIALSFIYTKQKETQKEAIVSNASMSEEGEEDPSFLSRFSRVSIYEADSGRQVIENARDSLPQNISVKATAKAYVVMDMNRDVTVLEKNADKLLPLASITKLVTAVMTKKLLDQNEYVIIEPRPLLVYGNEGRLREGEKLKVGELLYPLLMVSSNDAAEVLARKYDRKKFIEEMNNWVNSIGAYRTYFTDPSGLSPQNVSTAHDLSIIAKWIYKNEPEIFNITHEKTKTIRVHTWINPTHFLNLDSYIGGKNGYTVEAGRTSVALFKLGKQSRLFCVILLGSLTRDQDILELLDEALR